jgi:DeoR/GlpR family transcriptional regulator of sugar metabolism
MELLKRDGEVEISTLCRIFNVAEMTIRRDLNQLAKENNIIRTHGGALLVQEDQITEPSYERRITDSGESKTQIAATAIELIKNGERIFLDSGSTTYHIAKKIPNSARNVVLTNGINIAAEIMRRNNLSVIMIGGELRPNTLSTRGSLTEEYISQFHVDIAFVGANAIDREGNIYVANTSERCLKRAIMQHSDRTYVLLDHTKFGKTSLIKYANASELTGIISDTKLAQKISDEFEEKKINLIIAETSGVKK